ncbi:TPA: hypothetical protein ACH3X1_014328 [Trebouxia sp. C0004]
MATAQQNLRSAQKSIRHSSDRKEGRAETGHAQDKGNSKKKTKSKKKPNIKSKKKPKSKKSEDDVPFIAWAERV